MRRPSANLPLIALGKARLRPLRSVVRCLGEVLTRHGTRAIEWELDCGHTVVVPRYKERGGACARRRCKRCPFADL